MRYYEYVDKLKEARGGNAKKAILKVALKDEVFFSYVKEIYDYTWILGVRKIDKNITGDPVQQSILFPRLLNALKAGKGKRNTDAVNKVENIFKMAHPDELPALYKFLGRNMKNGVQKGLIKKIIPDMYPEFAVGLAKSERTSKLKFPAYIEPKLDGIRCLAFIKDREVTFRTRNGKDLEMDESFHLDILDLTVGHDFVLDGELMGTDFQALMKQARRKKNRDQSKLKFYIFDGMPLEDWYYKTTDTYTDRKNILMDMFGAWDAFDGKNDLYVEHDELPKLVLVRGQPVENEEALKNYHSLYVSLGLEGSIIKQDAEYPFSRSYTWMKMKPVDTFDCIITGFKEGSGKLKGSLGSFYVTLDGVEFNCGGKMSEKERQDYWNRRDELVGLYIEVEGDPKLTDDGKVRFPQFVQFRPDKD